MPTWRTWTAPSLLVSFATPPQSSWTPSKNRTEFLDTFRFNDNDANTNTDNGGKKRAVSSIQWGWGWGWAKMNLTFYMLPISSSFFFLPRYFTSMHAKHCQAFINTGSKESIIQCDETCRGATFGVRKKRIERYIDIFGGTHAPLKHCRICFPSSLRHNSCHAIVTVTQLSKNKQKKRGKWPNIMKTEAQWILTQPKKKRKAGAHCHEQNKCWNQQ